MPGADMVTRHLYCHIAYFNLNFSAIKISPGNRVIPTGGNATFTCYSTYHAPPYWHFYSLTPGTQPCGFGSYDLHAGISHCSSIPRISVKYSLTYRNTTNLMISNAQLSDAGVYTCGGRNPYHLTTTLSVIVGVIGKRTLCLSTHG